MKHKHRIIELRAQGCTYREISTILGCAKSTISFHCKSYNLLTIKEKLKNIKPELDVIKAQELYDNIGSCKEVGKILGFSKSTILKYVKINPKLNETDKKIHNSKNVISWRQRKKKELIEYKGSKCEYCGYGNSIWALHFHHIDPSKKDFTITGKSWSFDKLKAEVDKCLLLCANCHAEEHEKLHTLKMIEKEKEQ